MKQCFRCKETKPTEQFRKHKGSKDGLNSWCKPCEAAQVKVWNKKNPKGYLVMNSKQRAKYKGLEHNITTDDFDLPEYCPILNIKLAKADNVIKDNSYSLDRIDSSKGYVKGNVWVISHKANTMKSNASREEILCFAKYFIKTFN